MQRLIGSTVFALMFATSHAATEALELIAESGFNDQQGINSNTTPNSPFEFSDTVKGRGAGEGWKGNPWYAGDCCDVEPWRGVAIADSSLEGDGVLRMIGDRQTVTGEAWAYRVWGYELAGDIKIEQHIRLPENGFLNSRPGNGGLPSSVGPHWKVDGGRFFAMDGDGLGSGTFEDTGFELEPNQWHKVATVIYPDTETYDFFVDDVMYDAPDPLNFRGKPEFIDRVEYLAQTEAWVDQVRVFADVEPCDFDGDGILGVGDLDLLLAARKDGNRDPIFDVNDDGFLNFEDIRFFVKDESKLNTYIGDANLDGEFNSSDLVAVFTVGEYEDDMLMNSGWADGDWDGDGDFTSGDLVLAFEDGGYEQGPGNAANAVPEPTSVLMLLAGVIGIAIRRNTFGF